MPDTALLASAMNCHMALHHALPRATHHPRSARVAQALEAGPGGRAETVAVEAVGLGDCSPVFHAPTAASDPSGASASHRVVLTNIFPADSTAPLVGVASFILSVSLSLSLSLSLPHLLTHL